MRAEADRARAELAALREQQEQQELRQVREAEDMRAKAQQVAREQAENDARNILQEARLKAER